MGIASSVVGVVIAQAIDLWVIQILVYSCITGPVLNWGCFYSAVNSKYLTASFPLRGFISAVAKVRS